MAESIKGKEGGGRHPSNGHSKILADWYPRAAHYLQSAWPSLLMLLALIVVPVLALVAFIPPDVEPATAPASAFSAERALPHLQAIAQRPHPVGSPENAQVRDYLVQQLTAMGFPPEIQKTAVLSGESGSAAEVQNLLVRIPGTDPTRAVLITAHYDSVASSPGTGDDGVSIAAMLETLRALNAGPTLRNDLIFLFNDGEEPGMLGAQAFAEEHPWARDVGVAFDFDADSPVGRSIVLWTTEQDGWVVREIANSSAGVVASSFVTVDKRVDAGNDLRVLAKAGMTGAHLNIVAGSTRYHTMGDSLANLDERRLQDHGNVMLALARHFGDLSIGDTKAGNSVYFTAFGTTILHYPTSWALPLTLAGAFGLIAVIALGLWRRRLTLRGLAIALVVVMFGTVALAGLSHLGWLALLAAHPESRIFTENDFYGRTLSTIGLYAAVVTVVLALMPWLDRRLSTLHLALASAGLLVVALLLPVFDPTESYVVLLPALAAIAVLAVLVLTPRKAGHGWLEVRLVAQLLGVVVILGVSVPMLYRAAVDGLESGPALVVAILTPLLVVLAPQLALVGRIGRRWLPAAGSILAIGLIAIAIASSGQSATNPRPDSLIYGLNADRGEAHWITADSSPDSWTKQALTSSPRHQTLGEQIAGAGSEPVLTISAPATALPGPDLVLLGEQRNGDERTLRLRLVSPRQAYRYYLLPGPDVQLLAAGVDGKPLVAVENQVLRYDGLPAEGAELAVRVRATGPVQFTVVDQSSGLPQLPGVTLSPRPDTFMGLPGPEWAQGDPTLVWRSVVFE